jgi:hypothetical protein
MNGRRKDTVEGKIVPARLVESIVRLDVPFHINAKNKLRNFWTVYIPKWDPRRSVRQISPELTDEELEQNLLALESGEALLFDSNITLKADISKVSESS